MLYTLQHSETFTKLFKVFCHSHVIFPIKIVQIFFGGKALSCASFYAIRGDLKLENDILSCEFVLHRIIPIGSPFLCYVP